VCAVEEGFAWSGPVNGFRGLAKFSGFAGRVTLAREARNVNRKQGLTPRTFPELGAFDVHARICGSSRE
jgi:hypothetical protein